MTPFKGIMHATHISRTLLQLPQMQNHCRVKILVLTCFVIDYTADANAQGPIAHFPHTPGDPNASNVAPTS